MEHLILALYLCGGCFPRCHIIHAPYLPPLRATISSIIGATEESACSRRTNARNLARSSAASVSVRRKARDIAFAIAPAEPSAANSLLSTTSLTSESEVTTRHPAAIASYNVLLKPRIEPL